MRTMAKKLAIVLVAMLCSLCLLAGCNSVQPGLNKVLAIGMDTLPSNLRYEVGQYVDVTGGKVAVIYAENPDEKVVFDLTEDMLDKNSYDINTTGKKLVVVNYVYEEKTYSTGFAVEYTEKPFRAEAIEEINKYKSTIVYSTEGSKIVSAYKSLAVVNIKLSSTEAEAKSIVNNFKAKIDDVLTKADEELLASPSADIVRAQANAIQTIRNYKANEVSSYKENYARMVEAIKEIAYSEINLARTTSDINVAVQKAQANIDNASLGNKTLDEIGNAKTAAETAKRAAELAKDLATEASTNASNKAQEAEEAKAKAESAKVAAENAKRAAEEVKTKAENAKVAAENAKEAAKRIQDDVNSTYQQVSDALIASSRAQAAAKEAENAAVVAKNEANNLANKAEAEALNAEASKLAAENAKQAAESAKQAAEDAKSAAESAANEAKNYLEQIEAIYNALPVATTYIEEVKNYVNDNDYTGINKLLVVSLKDSYCAAIKASRSEEDIIAIVAKAKAALDLAQTVSDENNAAVSDLEYAKTKAKAEFKAYVNLLDYEAPTSIDLDKYKNLTDNPDQAKLIQKIEELIANVEAEIDAAQTTSEVDLALAKGQSRVYLETIYVDFYASCVVTELVELFRNDYEPFEILYSKENYNTLLNIVKHYETYIGRIDKLDEIDDKFDEAKQKLADVDTISGEIIDCILNISYPIRLNITVDEDNLAHYYPATAEEMFDSMDKELSHIQTLLDKVYAITEPTVQTRILGEITGYVDEENNTINLIQVYNKACDRYAKLVEAKDSTTDGASLVIDAIESIPSVDNIRLSTIGTVVTDARALWEAWVQKYFTDENCPVLDSDGNIDITLLETINLKMVTNYDKLVKAEARVEELKRAKEEAETPVTGIIAKIEAIDDENGYIVLASEALITEVDEMIEQWVENYHINDINMELISNKATLETFRARVEVLKQAKEAAETEETGEIAVIDAIINSIPEDLYITLAHKQTIIDARSEYEDWKTTYAIDETAEPINADLVTNRSLLVKYEERITQLENAKADAETATTGIIALIDAIPAYDPETPATNLLTLSNKSQVEDARAAYDTWIETYFTNNGYVAADEPTNTAIVSNYATLVKAEERIAQLEAAKADAETPTTGVIALIDAIKDVNSYVILDSENAIIAAEEALATWKETYAIDPVNEYLITNNADLVNARARLDELKQAKEAAETEDTGVIALIDAIADVNPYIILASESAITTADTAYTDWKNTYHIDETAEPLNADIVDNRDDLADAKARLAQLQNAKADAETADTGVIDLIEAIPQPVTLDDEGAIIAARNAYTTWLNTYEISEDEEPLNADIVSNRQVLADAISRYDNVLEPLLAETKAAINAIGNISVNSEAAIEAAETLYFELKNENKRPEGSTLPAVDLNAWLENGLIKLQNIRKEYEMALYVQLVENTTQTIEAKYAELTQLMGSYRSGSDKDALFNVSKDAKVALAIIPVPTPDPAINEDNLGDYDRDGYTNQCNSIFTQAIDDLYKSAKYIVTGDSENGYDVTIYANQVDILGAITPYDHFINIDGEDITVVNDIIIDELVGDGHVELEGITINGTVIVNGGGSSSVVFKKCAIINIIINKDGVRVAFDEDTTVENIIAGDTSEEGLTNSVIIELDGQSPEVDAHTSILFKGNKGDAQLVINVKDDEVVITMTFENVVINLDGAEDVNINGTDYDSEEVVIDSEGVITVNPVDIAIDSEKIAGEVSYTIEGTVISYGGEGELIPYGKVGAKFVAPSNVTDFSNVKVLVDGNEYIPTINGNYFEYILDVTEIPTSCKVVITWQANMSAMTYEIKVLEGTKFVTCGNITEDEDKLSGTNATFAVEDTVITFGGTIAYRQATETEEAGHYVKVKITPDAITNKEAVYELIKVTEEVLVNGKTFNYTWMDTEFTYTVKFDAETKLEFPVEFTKHYNGFDSYEATVEGNVMEVSGVIPYFAEALEIGRTEAHRLGIIIAPKYLGLDLTDAKLIVGDREVKFYDEFITTDNSLMYYPAVEAGTEKVEFTVVWNKYTEAQTYTINIAEGTSYEVPQATSVKINAEATAVKVFQTLDFTATVLSKYASQEVVWSVSSDIASIDENGTLTASKAGTVTVKVQAKDLENVYDEIEVTISNYKVNEIADLEANTLVTVDAQIVANQYNGYWIGDETGNILVYTGGKATNETIGSHVLVSGKVAFYNLSNRFTPQITSATKVEAEGVAPVANTTSVSYNLQTVADLDIDSYEKAQNANLYGKVLKLRGTASGSGNYWYINDENGNKFYISSSNNTGKLIANTVFEVEVIVREVFYLDDTSDYHNYTASMLGGAIISAKAYAEGNKILVVKNGNTDAEYAVDGLLYEKDQNLFASLAEALENVEEGETICLLPGTYSENVTINVNKVTITSLNGDLEPEAENRSEEAVCTGKITLDTGIENITISGVKFVGKGQIIGVKNNSNISILNCIFSQSTVSSTEGIILMKSTASNLVVKNCDFVGGADQKDAGRCIRNDGVLDGLVVENCTFSGAGIYDTIRSQGTLKGEVLITNNEFKESKQSAIMIMNHANGNFVITNNKFYKIQCTAIDIRLSNDENKNAKFEIMYNTFDNTGIYSESWEEEDSWGCIRFRAKGYSLETLTFNVNYNKFIKWGNFLLDNAANTSDLVFANFDYNYFDVEVKDADFSNIALSYDHIFESIAALDDAIEALNKKQTTVTLSISDYAKANSWSNSTKYSTINLDSSVKVTAVKTSGNYDNTGKYYTNGTNWRIYQNEAPTITFEATDCTIVSIKITYAISNTGVLTFGSENIASGTVVNINAATAVFGVGNTGTATNGQVRITAIEVVYEK